MKDTEAKKKELADLEEQVREGLKDFGDDVLKAFDALSEEMHKHMKESESTEPDEETPKYKGSATEEIEQEIKDFATRINKKIDENKKLLRKHKFGMILASYSMGSPTCFMGAGCRSVVDKKLVPFIKDQLDEE